MKTEKILKTIILSTLCLGITLIFTAILADVWGILPEGLAPKIIFTSIFSIVIPFVIFILYGIYKS